VILAIRTRPRDTAGVVHLVTGREQASVATDLLHHAGRIPPKHPRRRLHLGLRSADLGVDRIDGHRAHAYEQIAAGGCGPGKIEIEQAFRLAERQIAVETDGSHGCLSECGTHSNGGAEDVSNPQRLNYR